MSKGLLITGATGNQGGAVIDALISSPSDSSSFTILAVTRDPTSASAQKLEAKADNIKLVKGDMNDVPGIFSAAKAIHSNIWGVFSVQVPMGKGQTPQTEEAQGKALVDEAVKAGVQQFVQTSVDRGGDVSYETPTTVPHFLSKHNIEHHLVDETKGTNMNYTILRPVAFMENLKPGFPSKMFGALLRDRLGATKTVQWVSTKDIGVMAALAFRKPEQYRNRAISLAGDEMTFPQMDAAFQEKLAQPFPATYGFLGAIIPLMSHDFGEMMNFIAGPGYKADIPALKKEHPGLVDFKTWLARDSAFAKTG